MLTWEEEATSGIGVDPADVEALLPLLTEARAAAQRHPDLFRNYPHYEEIRAIGTRISDSGGMDAMQRTHFYILSRDRLLGSMLERFWDEIGSWHA
jgi:hypothetical protein